jgi:hypothetical protein
MHDALAQSEMTMPQGMTHELFVADREFHEPDTAGFQIPVPFWDPDTDMVETIMLQHTVHSRTRAAQRCIDLQRIDTVMVYGETVYKQGMVFMYLGKDQVPEHLARHRDKYANMVVVLSGDSNQVITCYRCPNPAKHLRRKQKNLSVFRQAA